MKPTKANMTKEQAIEKAISSESSRESKNVSPPYIYSVMELDSKKLAKFLSKYLKDVSAEDIIEAM